MSGRLAVSAAFSDCSLIKQAVPSGGHCFSIIRECHSNRADGGRCSSDLNKMKKQMLCCAYRDCTNECLSSGNPPSHPQGVHAHTHTLTNIHIMYIDTHIHKHTNAVLGIQRLCERVPELRKPSFPSPRCTHTHTHTLFLTFLFLTFDIYLPDAS